MKLSKRLLQQSYEMIDMTRLPARFFRRIIRTADVGIGSRCRVVGFRDDSIARYLKWLGFDVPEEARAPQQVARPPYAKSTTAQSQPASCEVVISSMSCPPADSLLEIDSLKRTAEWLASLKPGGYFVFVSQPDTKYDHTTHQPECFSRQLSVFPGTPDQQHHQPGSFWKFLKRRGAAGGASGYHTVAVQTPRDGISRSDWLAIAERAATDDASLCCDSTAIERPSAERPPAELRDAA